MARNDGKGNIIDRAMNRTFGETIGRVAKTQVDALFGSKIDDNSEYDSLADIRVALKETPDYTRAYKEFFEANGHNLDMNILNNKGIRERTISFYIKYLSGCNVETMFNSISDKVVSASTRMVTGSKNDGSSEEQSVNIDKLKSLDKAIATFGRSAVYVVSTGEDIEEFNYSVIEPYRYIIEDDRQLLFTTIGSYTIKNKQYPLFEVVESTKQDDGTWMQRRKHEYIAFDRTEKRHMLRTVDILEEVELESPRLYEVYNGSGGSDLDEIKQDVLVMDMIETIRAVEAKSSQFSIHADQMYFEQGRVIKQDVYRMIDSGFVGTERPLYEAFQPEMRVADYISYMTNVMEGMSRTLGVSTRSLGVTTASPTKQTATVALLDEEKTAETINNRKASLQRQFNKIVGVYYPDSYLMLPEYVSQSMAFKSEILKGLDETMSVEAKVNFLYPAWEETDKLREVLLVKIERNIPMTRSEREDAIDMDLIEE